MKTTLQRITLFLFLFLASFSLKAQLYEIGVFGGVTTYSGDLADHVIVWKQIRPAAGIVVRYTPLDFMALRANVIFGSFKAADTDSKDIGIHQRGYAVNRNVREMSIISEFHLPTYSKSGWGMFKPKFSPFLFIGVGLTALDGKPSAPLDRTPYPFPEQGDKGTYLSVPFGAGVKFHLAEKFAVSAEWGLRTTFNDYIDGVSKSANPSAHDYYMFLGMTATYVIGWDGDSPFSRMR
jgi:OmpA-OmpF porin, OOP family